MDPQVVGLYRQTPLEDALPAQANGGPREALQPAVVVASPEAQAASALIIAQSGDKGKADLLRADQRGLLRGLLDAEVGDGHGQLRAVDPALHPEAGDYPGQTDRLPQLGQRGGQRAGVRLQAGDAPEEEKSASLPDLRQGKKCLAG